MAELSEPFVGTIDRFGMSAMLATPIGRHLLDRMQQDPRVCAEAFNAALLDIRQARRARRLVARPLALDPVVELPLWETGPEGRRTVRADEPLNPERLRPKALLATALVRLAGCDGFIHGLGGAVYDEAMERWIERWLGETWATALAPRFTATATLRLPLPVSENPVEFDAVDLRRRMHDPVPATDGRNPSPQKRALLEEIDAAPRNSSQRIDAFNALQAWLEDGRRTQAGELEHLAEQVVDNHRAARSNAIATARDWAFPLHTHQSITEFVANPIRAAFAAQITPSSVK